MAHTELTSLVGWLPGSEAEPPGLEQVVAQDDATPTVLTKLQKWADYEAMGSPVWPTNFIPMKTPMSTEILDNWSLAEAPKHPLTVPLLLQRQAGLGREIGLIIDLANHDCLYSDDMPEELEYEHVQLIAKVLPSREAINEVKRIAKSFWAEHPAKYVGVHCAYGFNRTGFVVCSYLCQACGLSVEQALESFAAARPPGVKHEKFIRELYARYGGGSAVTATPEGSVRGGSTPPAEVEALAAEAQGLRLQAAAAAAEEAAGRSDAAQQQQEEEGEAGSARQGGSRGAAAAAPAPVAAAAPPAALPGSEGREAEEEEEEEPPHFEDAADMVRRQSTRQRSCSLSRGGGGASGELPLTVPSSAPMPVGGGAGAGAAAHRAGSRSRTPSRPGSAASSRNPSRHGGSQYDLAIAAAAAAAVAAGGIEPAGAAAGQQQQPPGEDADAAVMGVAAEGLAASRRLMQRKSSRGGGGGGLSLALGGTAGLSRPSGGSPHSSSSGVAASSSPVSGGVSACGARTAQSSMSDFAAAAVHLEGASHLRREGTSGSNHSMRRETSLGLAKALCEDFLQNNGTPSIAAPITAAAQAEWEEDGGDEATTGQAGATGVQDRPGSMSPDKLAAAAAASQQRFMLSSGGGGSAACADGPCSGTCESGDEADGSALLLDSPGVAPQAAALSSAGLGCSPTRRGGIPPPPGSRAQPGGGGCSAPLHPPTQQQQQQQQVPFLHPWQQHLQQQQHQGTPTTPAIRTSGSGAPGCSLQKQSSAGGFPRSVSMDSDNPSLGFGMREALAHLRLGAAGGGADGAPHRGPQALADLFREDSIPDMGGQLDAEEHLQALALHGGRESPAAPAGPPLPSLAEVAASAEAGSSSDPSVGSLLLHQQGHLPAADGVPGGTVEGSSAASTPLASSLPTIPPLSPQQQQRPASAPARPAVPATAALGPLSSGSPGRMRNKQRSSSSSGKGRCRVM